MRRVTPQEREHWRTLAQHHGFGSAENRFVLGRFVVEDRDEDGLVLCVVTPIPAGLAMWRRSKRCHRELGCESELGVHLAPSRASAPSRPS